MSWEEQTIDVQNAASSGRPGACFSKVPKLFGRILGDIILFVSSKRRRLEARNFPVIFIFIPLQHMKRPALQNKQVVILRMAFRARKVLGTFDKRALGHTKEPRKTKEKVSEKYRQNEGLTLEKSGSVSLQGGDLTFISFVVFHLHTDTPPLLLFKLIQVIWWRNSEDWGEKF